MWRSVPIKPEAILPVSLVAAMLLALPVAAQTAPPPPAESGTPRPVVGDTGTPAPGTTPALTVPTLGPLSGRDNPLAIRPASGAVLPGFSSARPGLGLTGFGPPLELGNRTFGFQPSIAVEVLGSNRLQNGRSKVVTTVAPGIEAAVDSVRLLGSLRYTPALRLYGTHWGGVDQIGDGRLLAALLPGLFYLDVRGAARVLPTTAGQLPGSGQAIGTNNTTQSYTAQVTPFVAYRLGSLASMQAGYSFLYSRQNASDFAQTGLDGSEANYIAHRGFAVLRSGEYLGRLALQARVDNTWYVGDGIYDGARQFVTALEARYAILRSVAVFGEIGYEKQRLAGTNPFRIDGVIWSGGLRLTPTPDSIVVVRYGRRSGFNSFSVNAGVALGVRTNFFATYQETLSTSLSQAQDLLANTTTDARGDLVDSQSGAPVALFNSFLGQSNTLYKMRTGTASLRYSWPRDTFTLSGTYQSQIPITSANPAVATTTNRGAYGTFSWAHEFSRRTTGVAILQYGRFSAGQTGGGYANVYAAAATLSHELTEKLTGNLQFSWSRDSSFEANGGESEFVVRAALRRLF